MKQILKRMAALAVASLICISALTACGDSLSLMSFLPESSSGADFGGYVFKLGDAVSSEDDNFMAYKVNTVLYDLTMSRLDAIEKTYNCEIDIQYVTHDSKDLIQDIVGAARKYDLLYLWHEQGQLLARGNVLVPAYEYRDVIDLSNTEKYGTMSVQEANAYKGEYYLISPQSWLYHQPGALDVLVFNMELVDRYGKTNPREYLESSSWNWNAFESVVTDYYVKEGDKEVYSLACRCFDVLKLLCLGNGVSFTYKDSNGDLKSDFGKENMLEAVNFYNKLFSENTEKLALKVSGEIDWADMNYSFISQQNSMACLTTASSVYNDISYELDSYAVMPFPTGPQGEYGVWPAIIEGVDGFAVPITCDEESYAFRLIDLICEPLEGYETEESRIAFLAENVFFNEVDAEIALTAHKNGSYSYWKADVGNFGPDLFWRRLAESPSTEKTAKVIGQYESKYNTAIAEYMTPNLDLVKYFE